MYWKYTIENKTYLLYLNTKKGEQQQHPEQNQNKCFAFSPSLFIGT